jgi:hypothetical protein
VFAPANPDLQLKTHRIQNVENGVEVWKRFAPRKSSINARSFNSRFFRNFRDIMQVGGGTDGFTNPDDV